MGYILSIVFVSLYLCSQLICCTDSNKPLILTPLIESGKLNKARRLSRVRGNQFDCNTNGFSGFLTVNKQFNSNLFFWFFKSNNQKKPILLWLQGGPGESSLNTLFNINGPYKISKNSQLKCRKYSWTKAFSVLYIDSPVGAGFSYTENESGYARNLENVTDNLFAALKQFFTLFGELKRTDFYITGVSYGGKYVPALAYKIHTSDDKFLNLKGIAVGNGFIDPISSLSYGPHLYQKGLIDDNQKKVFDEKEKEIQSLIQKDDFEEAFKKWDQLITKMLFSGKTIFETFTGYSFYYDFRYTVDPLGNYSKLIGFLNLPSTRKAIHVGNRPYILGGDTNAPVLKPMIGDIVRSVKTSLKLIFDNYKVLLYAGNMDLILPGVIAHNFLNTFDWKQRNLYLNATRQIWKVAPDDKEVAGYIKQAGSFWEVIVRNSGHTLLNQPRASFDLITKFVNF